VQLDLHKVIQFLRLERQKVDDSIAELENLQNDVVNSGDENPKKRGRKSMGPKERQEVSDRLKRYWASRR
jgi:hypothetical protein